MCRQLQPWTAYRHDPASVGQNAVPRRGGCTARTAGAGAMSWPSAALFLLIAILSTVAVAQALPEAWAQTSPQPEASLRRNFYFVFDGSGSMAEALSKQCQGDKRFSSRLDGAKWAVEQFLPHVPADVNLGLWIFDASGNRERVPLGAGNRHQFLTAIQKASARGKTPLTEALEAGAQRLVQQRDQQLGYGEFRLIVVTDGQATGRPLAQGVRYAQQHHIPIYTIGLCLAADHDLRKYSVSYRAADSIEALQRGLEETLAETSVFDPQTFPGR